jgi:hypothetical protein
MLSIKYFLFLSSQLADCGKGSRHANNYKDLQCFRLQGLEGSYLCLKSGKTSTLRACTLQVGGLIPVTAPSENKNSFIYALWLYFIESQINLKQMYVSLRFPPPSLEGTLSALREEEGGEVLPGYGGKQIHISFGL